MAICTGTGSEVVPDRTGFGSYIIECPKCHKPFAFGTVIGTTIRVPSHPEGWKGWDSEGTS